MGKPRLHYAQKGKAVSATAWNAMVDWLKQLPNVEGGPGVNISRSASGLVIALALLGIKSLALGRVTRVVYLDGDSANKLIENVAYDAVVIGEPQATVTARVPKYLRVYESGPLITPAEVGDLCIIVRANENAGARSAELMMLTERVRTRRCQPQPRPGSDPAAVKKKRPLDNTNSIDAMLAAGLPDEGGGGGSGGRPSTPSGPPS